MFYLTKIVLVDFFNNKNNFERKNRKNILKLQHKKYR